MSYQHKVILFRVLKSELEEDVAKRCCQSLEQKRSGGRICRKKKEKSKKAIRTYCGFVLASLNVPSRFVVIRIARQSQPQFLSREKKNVKWTHLIEQVIL